MTEAWFILEKAVYLHLRSLLFLGDYLTKFLGVELLVLSLFCSSLVSVLMKLPLGVLAFTPYSGSGSCCVSASARPVVLNLSVVTAKRVEGPF